jgi:hypothetical protein
VPSFGCAVGYGEKIAVAKIKIEDRLETQAKTVQLQAWEIWEAKWDGSTVPGGRSGEVGPHRRDRALRTNPNNQNRNVYRIHAHSGKRTEVLRSAHCLDPLIHFDFFSPPPGRAEAHRTAGT